MINTYDAEPWTLLSEEPASFQFLQMIFSPRINAPPAAEPAGGRPVASGEQWLGRSAGKPQGQSRHLWQRLNPRHRKLLRLLAQALVLRQSQARLPEPARARLHAVVEDAERLMSRVEKLLVQIANRGTGL